MNKFLLLLVSIIATNSSHAQTPVWSTDIAPILYNKCATCHRSGGIAPFQLLDYNDAQTHSGTIAAQVQNRTMPPWPPDPSYNRLAHERLLSQQEIDKISNWVNGGAPSGTISAAPPVPTFSNTGDLPGTPDHITKMPVFTSTASTGDVYQCFVIPSGISTDKYITALEAIPGNRGIVHHVLVYADTTGICHNRDVASPGPGYVNFGGVGTDSAILLGVWVPGGAPLQYPSGFGALLPKNADIVLQVHYPAGTAGQVDSTEIHFFFSTTPVTHAIRIDPILNHTSSSIISPYPLSIPANQTKTFSEHFLTPLQGSLLGVMPHMHLIGKSINCFSVSGSDTQKYIRINDWNFHWQGFYMMRKLVKIPGFSTLYSQAYYDNTTNNPENPSSPPITVNAGESTTDEMMITYFIWTPYQAGDENIVIDNSPLVDLGVAGNYYKQDELFQPYPNPAKKELTIKCYFNNEITADVELVDIQGRLIKTFIKQEKLKGYIARPYSVEDIPNGTYILRMRAGEKILTEKIAIEH
jgi:hypothetical protein